MRFVIDRKVLLLALIRIFVGSSIFFMPLFPFVEMFPVSLVYLGMVLDLIIKFVLLWILISGLVDFAKIILGLFGIIYPKYAVVPRNIRYFALLSFVIALGVLLPDARKYALSIVGFLLSVPFLQLLVLETAELQSMKKENSYFLVVRSRLPLLMKPVHGAVRFKLISANIFFTEQIFRIEPKRPLLELNAVCFRGFGICVMKKLSKPIHLISLGVSTKGYPGIGVGDLVSKKEGASPELLSIRKFQPGDKLSAIIWKELGRKGNLMVKAFSKLQEERCLLILDLTNLKHGTLVEKNLFNFLPYLEKRDVRVGLVLLGEDLISIGFTNEYRKVYQAIQSIYEKRFLPQLDKLSKRFKIEISGLRSLLSPKPLSFKIRWSEQELRRRILSFGKASLCIMIVSSRKHERMFLTLLPFVFKNISPHSFLFSTFHSERIPRLTEKNLAKVIS